MRRRLELGQRPRRHGDEVADAADLEQHGAVEAALEHLAAQRADHRAARLRAARRRRGRASAPIARWHSASAAASAASAGCGGLASPRRACTIFCTCSLPAPPQPATASLTWFGVYWATSQPARGRLGERQPAGLADAHRRAHVDLEEDLLDGDRVGPELGDQRRQLGAQRGEALRQRIGRRRADHAERRRP